MSEPQRSPAHPAATPAHRLASFVSMGKTDQGALTVAATSLLVGPGTFL